MDKKFQAAGCQKTGAYLLGLFTLFLSQFSFALGTDAGVNIENSATVNFEIGGLAQTPVDSNTTQTLVDELLEVAVVSDDGGPVAVGSPDTDAVLQFSVTNNGNGDEVYRIVADDDVAEGGFNPSLTSFIWKPMAHRVCKSVVIPPTSQALRTQR